MVSPCLCKSPTASEPASRVKPVLKQTFGRASREAAHEALPRAVPNGAFDCSIISGHSSRKIFCGYKLNTLLRLRTFCCELCHLHKNVPRTGILAAPLDLPASCVTRHAYPALPDSQQVFCPASLGFQAVVLVLDFQLLPSLLVCFC